LIHDPRPVEPLTERTPRVVSSVKLHRTADRKKTGEFLAEGSNAVASALDGGHVKELFYTADAGGRVMSLVDRALKAGLRASLVNDKAARALGDTVTPPGLVAVCTQIDVPLTQVVAEKPQLLAVPIDIADPGNAGTLVRVSDAVGADAVIFAGNTVDPHNGKCVRASAGSLFHLPIVRERDIATALDSLTDIRLFATAADGEVDLDDAEELLAGPTAWLFGNEAHGLPSDVLARADHRIRIPIQGRAESLNLAAAAAICLYASSRAQRHGKSIS
jgi:RNA methyltransferase, TrmH family